MEQTPSDTYALKNQDTNLSIPKKNKFSKKPLIDGDPGDIDYSRKHSYETRVALVKAIATHMDPKDIIQMMSDSYGVKTTVFQIHYYKNSPNWKPMIEKEREKFEAEIGNEPLASKRIRIRELSKAYQRLEPNEDTLMDSVKILGEIRMEVEGKTSEGISITQYNQYNGIPDDDLRKLIAENTRFLEVAEKRQKQLTIEMKGDQDAMRIEGQE